MRATLLLVLLGMFGCQLVFKAGPGDSPGDGGPDVIGKACERDEDCEGLICDTAADRCVQCTDARQELCAETTPVCGDDNSCRGCVAHSECASEVCLLDGACAAPEDVAYVRTGDLGVECTQQSPCGHLAEALLTTKSIIKIAAGPPVIEPNATLISGRILTIFADPGAKLDRMLDGPILAISGNSTVAIYDLEITGQSGANDFTITLTANGGAPRLSLTRVNVIGNQGGAILASSGTALAVSQSTIAQNTGGGISISGAQFALTNNFIFRNGNPDSATFGGVSITAASPGDSVFEFNTVVDNRSSIVTGGVNCNSTNFTAANNIIARNFVGATAMAPTAGNCMIVTSVTQNGLEDLVFESSEGQPFDYHLKAGSTAAIDRATTASNVSIDYDGQDRPSAKDIGADELP